MKYGYARVSTPDQCLNLQLDALRLYGVTASIRIATLLDKPERRAAPLTPDYCCFTVPDEFVVGYGLDYDEKFRNLPYIGVLKPEVYTK